MTGLPPTGPSPSSALQDLDAPNDEAPKDPSPFECLCPLRPCPALGLRLRGDPDPVDQSLARRRRRRVRDRAFSSEARPPGRTSEWFSSKQKNDKLRASRAATAAAAASRVPSPAAAEEEEEREETVGRRKDSLSDRLRLAPLLLQVLPPRLLLPLLLLRLSPPPPLALAFWATSDWVTVTLSRPSALAEVELACRTEARTF